MRPGIATLALAAIAALAAVAPASSAGGGRVLQVHPGQLHDALERAVGGDTLVIHQGRYRGIFVIPKRLRLIGAEGERRPVIDGRCATNVTLAVRHDGVVLRRLQVIGAEGTIGSLSTEVDFHEVSSGMALGLRVRDSCDAEYGINVFGSGEVKVIGNRGAGFEDSAIYVGGITSTGDGVLRVARNDAYGNNRGFIVEDSAGGRIELLDNRAHGNVHSGEGPAAGFFLRNSDAVLLARNVATDNGRFGFQLDATSDGNRLFANTARRNPGGNFHDEGVGNCGARNDPNPFPPC